MKPLPDESLLYFLDIVSRTTKKPATISSISQEK